MRRPLVTSLAMLMLLSCSRATENIEGLPVYFPLSEGTYWAYQGTVKWTVGQEVMQKDLTWKMEVVETVKRDHITGYALKGHPSDLAWYEDNREPSAYAMIQIGPNKFYKAGAETLARLKDDADALEGLVHEGQLILDFPLASGKRFCPTEQMNRADGKYCWLVEQDQQTVSWDMAGVPSSESITEYSVRFVTLPDHVIVHFAEGIGITRYEYVHHGTVSEVNLKLIEYHPASAQK